MQMLTPFGVTLREWRARRRMSQLDLAGEAGVSARHVAFLETGRAQPSRMMVGQLMDALDVPLRDRNVLLAAAGFAPVHSKLALDDLSLAPLVAGLERILDRHAPYPALMLDRDWNVLSTNATAALMLQLVGGEASERNLLTRLFNSVQTPLVIENWPVLAAEFLSRLKAEALKSSDRTMLERVMFLRAQSGLEDGVLTDHNPALSVIMRLPDGRRISLYSVVGHFSGARDITAADVWVELFFPADQSSKDVLDGLAA